MFFSSNSEGSSALFVSVKHPYKYRLDLSFNFQLCHDTIRSCMYHYRYCRVLLSTAFYSCTVQLTHQPCLVQCEHSSVKSRSTAFFAIRPSSAIYCTRSSPIRCVISITTTLNIPKYTININALLFNTVVLLYFCFFQHPM